MWKTSKEQTHFKLQNPDMVAYTYNPTYKAEANTLTCMCGQSGLHIEITSQCRGWGKRITHSREAWKYSVRLLLIVNF